MNSGESQQPSQPNFQDEIGAYQKELLNGHGIGRIGEEAFENLCELGCDPAVLGDLIVWLVEGDTVELERESEQSQKIIRLRPLDDLEHALGGLQMRVAHSWEPRGLQV